MRVKTVARWLGGGLGGLVGSVALSVSAQQDGGFSAPTVGPQLPFSVLRFSPAPGPRNFITTRSARTDGESAFSFGLLMSYASEPFVIESCQQVSEGLQCVDVRVVENLVVGDALASFTPIPQLQLGVRVPITFVEGDGLVGGTADFDDGGVNAFGLADIELEAKARAVGKVDSPFNLGLAGWLTLPTGELTAADSFIGDETPSAGLRVIFDGRQDAFAFAVNAGYVFRGDVAVGGSTLGNAFTYSAAALADLSPTVGVIVDAFGSSQRGGEPGSAGFELDAALRVSPLGSGIVLTAGGGAALASAVGYPAARLLLGFQYVAEFRDQDDDGIADREDGCPTAAEDGDGYEDEDGCPELDNDGDAIVDENDRCPDQAEDVDQHEDLDGCPDPDNDGDGIVDVQDRCPLEPETVNGWEDQDGCPDVPDRDGDGVKDDVDECPNEAEDTDGFQDTDGCPEPDNDQDGILDEADECVDVAEDLDGVEDEDGCPEDEPAPTARSRKR